MNPADAIDDYWRNKTYETNGVPGLPRVVIFNECKPARKITVNYALVAEVEKLYTAAIKQAASKGDNIGLDEFSDEDIELRNAVTEIFVCRDYVTNEFLGFIGIAPSDYSRSFDSLSAELIILRTFPLVSDDAFYRGMLRLAQEFTVTIGMKYTMATINTSLSCTNILRILRQEGFNITAILPRCVLMAPGTLYSSAILVKQLVDADREPRSLEEIQRACEKVTNSKQFEKEYLTMELPRVTFVPYTYTFNCGITITCRMMRKDEDRIVFELMQKASSKGEGFARYEHPGINELRKYMLAINPCVVYENIVNKEFVGFSIIGHCYFSRTSSVKSSQTDTILKENYRGLGLGKEIVALEIAMQKELKHEMGINDTLMNNSRMLSILRNHRSIISVGTFPKAGYTTETSGWTDYILNYLDLSEDRKFKTLSELLRESKQRSKL